MKRVVSRIVVRGFALVLGGLIACHPLIGDERGDHTSASSADEAKSGDTGHSDLDEDAAPTYRPVDDADAAAPWPCRDLDGGAEDPDAAPPWEDASFGEHDAAPPPWDDKDPDAASPWEDASSGEHDAAPSFEDASFDLHRDGG